MAKTTRKVDGTRYYHYREHFVRTGSLRSFGLMMRHYEASGLADLTPVPQAEGKRRRPPVLYDAS